MRKLLSLAAKLRDTPARIDVLRRGVTSSRQRRFHGLQVCNHTVSSHVLYCISPLRLFLTFWLFHNVSDSEHCKISQYQTGKVGHSPCHNLEPTYSPTCSTKPWRKIDITKKMPRVQRKLNIKFATACIQYSTIHKFAELAKRARSIS